jgi:PAS domain S-box-containing protein
MLPARAPARPRTVIAALALAVAAGLAGEARAGPPSPPTVLILASYHRGFTWTDQETDGAVAALRARWPDLQPYVEHLDRKRFQGAAAEEALRRFLVEKYRGLRIDGLVATDDAAFDFALAARDDLFGRAPLAFCGVNGEVGGRLAGLDRVTGVVEWVDVAGTFGLVRALQPDVARILVVLDGTETSAGIAPRVAAAARALGPGVEVSIAGAALSHAELEARVAGLDRRTAVVLGSFNVDRLGAYRSYEQVAEAVAARSAAPVYGLWGFQLGHGVVGGSLLGGEDQGRRAGELLIRLLDGVTEPVDERSPATLSVDDRAAARWGLDPEARLPDGAYQAINRPERVWHRYRAWFLGAALSLVALAIFSGALLDLVRRMRRTEHELRESEERYRSIVDSVEDAIFIHDAASGEVLDVNRRACELYGAARADLIAAGVGPISEGSPPYSSADAEGWMARCRTDGPQRFEWLARRRDGATFWVEVAIRQAAVAGQARLVVAVRDIAERKRAEAQRAALERRLEEGQRLESIGRLAGGVAHDFNNLLTPILGNAQGALDALGAAHPVAEDLRGIVEAAGRAGALTRQLLALSRRQLLQERAVDLNAEVGALHAMLRRTIGEDVEVRLELDPALGRVRGDPSQLQQVLLNLAVNARDAMPGGGLLTIATRNVAPEEAAGRAGARARSLVELSVSDSGTGMTPEVRARLFEPFFTTKPHGKGTGLGLATVLGVVKQHGGEVEVESAPGQGSTFRILLPRDDAARAAVPPAPAPAAEGRRGGRVLLVEDEPGVRRLVEGYLRGAGYEVLAAADGHEALELAARAPGGLDLLLSDVVMPGMNGRELYLALAAHRAGLRVLYMSGYPALPSTLQDLVEGGRDAFIAKPFTRAQLLARLDEVLAAAPPAP